tara:strand:+ start:18 stop:767 length:750 start_codon:yes stop_codon:yes gene_type:complete
MLRKYIRKIICEGPGVTRSQAKLSSRYKKIAPNISSQNFQKLSKLGKDDIEQAIMLGNTLDPNYEKLIFLEDNETIEEILENRFLAMGMEKKEFFEYTRYFKKNQIKFTVYFSTDMNAVQIVFYARGWKAMCTFDLLNFKNKGIPGTHGVGYSNPDNWGLRTRLFQDSVYFYTKGSQERYRKSGKNYDLGERYRPMPREDYNVEAKLLAAVGQSETMETYELTLSNITRISLQILQATKEMATEIEHIE